MVAPDLPGDDESQELNDYADAVAACASRSTTGRTRPPAFDLVRAHGWLDAPLGI
ncbi:MAG TPA: hypothetical protein VF341_13150 [Anaeromyxobacteraceae bacterium]